MSFLFGYSYLHLEFYYQKIRNLQQYLKVDHCKFDNVDKRNIIKYASFQFFFLFFQQGKKYTTPFLYTNNIFEIYIVDVVFSIFALNICCQNFPLLYDDKSLKKITLRNLKYKYANMTNTGEFKYLSRIDNKFLIISC